MPTSTLKMRVGKVYRRADRNAPGVEPVPDEAIPDRPFVLSGVAASMWDLLITELPKTGCLTKQDAGTLALACQAFQAAKQGEKWGFAEWRHYSALFGLSPSDRAALSVTAAKGAKVGARDREKDRKAG